jgi:hypothetical protein
MKKYVRLHDKYGVKELLRRKDGISRETDPQNLAFLYILSIFLCGSQSFCEWTWPILAVWKSGNVDVFF